MKNTSAVFAICFSALALPSLADAPFNVDSPSLLEANSNLILLKYTSSAGNKKENETVPGLVYQRGLSRDWEFKFETGLATARTQKKERETGLGDTFAQIRWRFVQETKFVPSVAFGYKIKIPTANRLIGLGSGFTDNSVWLTAAKSFGRFRIYGNIGDNLLGAPKSKDNLFYGAVTTYKLTERLTVGAQVYGNAPKAAKTKDELAWGLGATYRYAPDHVFFASAGKSERGYSNLNVTAGIKVVFK